MTNISVSERLDALRDDVLHTAELGDRDRKGGEVFAAVVRLLANREEGSSPLDLTLHEAISQRMAWGDPEGVVLADADSVCKRVLEVSRQAFSEPEERLLIADAVCEIGIVAARMIASAALGRAGRERASLLREEVLQLRLQDAVKRQEEELAELSKQLGR
jgi:hypothetical protein